MDEDRIIDFFRRTIQRIKRFLTSKDLFIFLLFLVISIALWGLQAMRKTYETVITVPVDYVNMPVGLIQTEELPRTLQVTVSDRGSALLSYRIGKYLLPVRIDMSNLVNEKKQISTKMFELAIHQELSPSTQIIKIAPDYLQFNFVHLKKKKLPVKLNSRIELFRQYMLIDTVRTEPQEVEVYAPDYMLDTMQFAHTEPFSVQGLKDTIVKKLNLKKEKNVSYSPAFVTVTAMAELYTEKTAEAPIIVAGLPPDRILRIFPSTVQINFQVGLSLYNEINASAFVLAVDYRDIKASSDSEKLPVKIEKQPKNVFNVKITPKEVDYLIEIKDSEAHHD